MKSRPFRLRVEQFEDRLTPSGTPVDVYNALHTIKFNTEILKFVTDEQLVGSPFTLPYVQNFIQHVHDTNTVAVAELNDFMSKMMTQHAGNVYTSEFHAEAIANVATVLVEGHAGIAYATNFATTLSLPLNPPVPPPPPPSGSGSGSGSGTGGGQLAIDLTSDSGMVNTMPSIVGFSDIGNGVKVKDILVGEGTAASTTSTVSVYYTGWLSANGTQFDARRSPLTPISFSLTGTIDGFQAGVAGMKPGGIRQIFIPAAQAYGAAGQGNVPPNADLVFEVKLITTT